MELFFRYVHFMGILAAAGTLTAEALLTRKRLNGLELRRLALLDGVYGLSALVLVAGGLMQWFMGGKPSTFYTSNPVFIAKVTLVGIIGLLSIVPTVWFIRHRAAPEADQVTVPGMVRAVVKLEVVLMLLVPLLAVLMARGIGLG
jgi:putative membrane protein